MSPEQLFYMSCREAMRDGQVEGPENEFLRDLRLSLVLSSERARQIFEKARREFQEGQISPGGAMEPDRVFQNACRLAWRDGVVTEEERGLLLRLGDLLGLPEEERARAFTAAVPPHLRGTVEEAWAPPEPQAPAPPGPVPPPPPPQPAPGPGDTPPGDGGADAAPAAPEDFPARLLVEIDAWQAEGILSSLVADHLRARYRSEASSRAAGVLADLRVVTGVAPPASPGPTRDDQVEDPDDEVAAGSVPEVGYDEVMGEGGGGDDAGVEILHITASDTAAPPPPAPEWELSSTMLLAVLGALCVGLGAILLVAANWQEITPAAKVVLVLCAVTGSYLAAYEVGLREGQAPMTGYALVLMGALLYAAGIALVAQIYHLTDHVPLGFLLWAVGVLPMAYVARSRALLHGSLVVLGIWTIGEQAAGTRSLAWLALVLPLQLRMVNPLFPFLAGAAAWAGGRALGTWETFGTAGFFVWIWLLFVPIEKDPMVSLQLSITYGLLLLGLAPWKSRDAGAGYGWAGYVLTLSGAFVFSFSSVCESLCEGIAAQYTDVGVAAVAVSWMLHAATLALWGVLSQHAEEPAEVWTCKVGVGASLAALSPWLLFGLGAYVISIVYNALYVAVCLGAVRAGVLEGDASRVDWSVGLIFAWVVFRYFEYFSSLGSAGLSLVVGGAFLSTVAFLIERWRRSLQAELAEKEQA